MANEVVRRQPHRHSPLAHVPPPRLLRPIRRHRALPHTALIAAPVIPERRTTRPAAHTPPATQADHPRRRHPPVPNPAGVLPQRESPAAHVPPPALLVDPRARRRRIPSPTASPVGKRRRVRPGKPATGRRSVRCRRRLPGTGLSALSFIVRRARQARRSSPVAAARPRHSRRRRLISGVTPNPVRKRLTGRLPRTPGPEIRSGLCRRRRLAGTGLSAGLFRVRRPRRRCQVPGAAALVPHSHPRRKPLGTGRSALSFVVGRRRLVRLPRSVVAERSGRPVRGRLSHTGLAAGLAIVKRGRRIRVCRVPAVGAICGGKRSRRIPIWLGVLVINSPWHVAASDVYVSGAVAGTIAG